VIHQYLPSLLRAPLPSRGTLSGDPMGAPGQDYTIHPGLFPSHRRTHIAIRRNGRTSRFIPSAIQYCCCASVVESSLSLNLLISYLLSELLQSASIHPHICIIARRSLYLPIKSVVCGGRSVPLDLPTIIASLRLILPSPYFLPLLPDTPHRLYIPRTCVVFSPINL